LFKELSGGKWRVKFDGKEPKLHTLRHLTEAEKQDFRNTEMLGVRTYFFFGYHMRGLTEFNFENSDYEDYAWIPKQMFNKYFGKSYFDIMKKIGVNR